MARFVCQPLFCDGLTPPIDFNDNSNCRPGPRARTTGHSPDRPLGRGLRGARSSNCRPWSRAGPILPRTCLRKRRPPAWRLPSLPAWCYSSAAMLRRCPPFITRSVARSASGMRPPMKHSTSSQRTVTLDTGFRCSSRSPPATRSFAWDCSGHQGRLAHATQVDSWTQRSRSRGIIQVVFCYFLRRAGMLQSHGYTYGFLHRRRCPMTTRGWPAKSGRGGHGTASPCCTRSAATASAWPTPISSASQPPGASTRAASPAIAR
jgi:hypothetical protein